MSAPNSLFVRAARLSPPNALRSGSCARRAVTCLSTVPSAKSYSLIEICKKPEIAAQVTIEAAEILKVDAAIIFADLLLPLEVMGLPFHFAAGEGPKIEKPVRTPEDIAHLRTDRAAELGYVAEAVAWSRSTLRPIAGHRILRRSLYARQLHDRGRRIA